MLIKEYRILLPLTVEEYRIAQLYMIQKKSRLESSGQGSGVEIITNEPYENGPGGSGQYTFKIYHISNRIPAWIRTVLPATALDAHEESWNAYPFTKTRYSCQLMDRFHIDVETRYSDDAGTQDNIFNLSDNELRNREIDVMDFVNDPISDYHSEEDPKLFRSEKTGRGPLSEKWLEERKRDGKPIMCAYKKCRVEFRYWGLQTRAERWIHDLALRQTMLRAHRQAWAWQDEWVDLTMADIRRLEADAAHYLSNVMSSETLNPGELKNKPSSENFDAKFLSVKGDAKKQNTKLSEKRLKKMCKHDGSNILHHGSTDSSKDDASGSNNRFENLEEADEDDAFLSPLRSGRHINSKYKNVSNVNNNSKNSDEDSDSGDIFFDCYDQLNFNNPKSEKLKPTLIRWSSELLLESNEGDEIPMLLTPRTDPNSSLLILVFHGDIFPDNPADSKTTDAMSFYSTLEHIVKSHYPQLKGRFHVLQVSCGKELVSTFMQLKGISSHFNVFHPSFALLLASHHQTFRLAIQRTIRSANAVLDNFLRSEAGANFKNAEIFSVGDYVGGLLMYEAMTKWSSSTPSNVSLKEHRQVFRNYSSVSARSIDHSHERDASSCSLFEYNIEESIAVPSGGPPTAENNSIHSLNSNNEDANNANVPYHRSLVQVASWDPRISSRNLSAPPSANFRLPTASSHLTTSFAESNNDHWALTTSQNEVLTFKANSAFLLGCPLALVLMLRKLSGQEVPELECEQLFNLYYPLDSCAGRLEPVMNAQLATLPPLAVPRYQRHRPTCGSGRQFFFDNALDLTMPWGSRRVDHELYCPSEMTSLPASVLPNILHASYWESKDVGEFILRQFVRADNSVSPDARNASINAAKNLLMDCEIPPKVWNRRRTKFKIANLTANHRANDLIIVNGAEEQDAIHARFCYGPMDLVALSLENILVYVRPINGKWVLNSREMTDTHGRVAIRLNHSLPVGVHEVRIIVQGDRSFLNLYVAVVPPETECVVFSIDGSLTGSMSVTGRDPRVKPGAVDVVRYWQQQGYLVIYVTARPDMQQRLVAHWLTQHNFPHGLLYFIPSISTDPLKQKALLLRQLVDQKLKICAAYGSAKDVHVYASVGVEWDRIFRVGSCSSKKRSQDCVPLEDGYALHLHSIHSGEVAIARAVCGNVSSRSVSGSTSFDGDNEETGKNLFAQQQRSMNYRSFIRRNDLFAPRSGKYSSFHSGNKKNSQISISTR